MIPDSVQSTPAPELSRVVAIDRLPPHLTVLATPEECQALATRLLIPEVRALMCRFVLKRQGTTVLAEGEMRAEVVQSCVVTLEPVEQSVQDRFTIRFVPASAESNEPDEADPDTPDLIPYHGSIIDLGEAATEQLALALDPYPRQPGAELDRSALDPDPSPFGGLAALRPKQ